MLLRHNWIMCSPRNAITACSYVMLSFQRLAQEYLALLFFFFYGKCSEWATHVSFCHQKRAIRCIALAKEDDCTIAECNHTHTLLLKTCFCFWQMFGESVANWMWLTAPSLSSRNISRYQEYITHLFFFSFFLQDIRKMFAFLARFSS